MAEAEKRLGEKIHTEILPAETFYLAEDYHQKYMLRRDRSLMRDFTRMYPKVRDFINSTAAARLNGLLGGHRLPGTLRENPEALGLSAEGEHRLAQLRSAR